MAVNRHADVGVVANERERESFGRIRKMASWRYEDVQRPLADSVGDRRWDGVVDLPEPFLLSDGRSVAGMRFLSSANGSSVPCIITDRKESFLFSSVNGRTERWALLCACERFLEEQRREARESMGYLAVIGGAYSKAFPTDERITGAYAKDFAGPVSWSRALDFDIPDDPSFRGLRFIDFKDCTLCHVLRKDGESVSVDSLGPKELRKLSSEVERQVARMQTRKYSVKKGVHL
jgi:hypothetical protein